MATNVEIKAYVRDPERLRRLAEGVSDTPAEVIHQRDVFLNTERGRLKLRTTSSDHGYLVYYERANVSGPRPSEYYLSETQDPASLERLLTRAFGVRGTVVKVRTLYMAGNTRIHLDQVEGLGHFCELEVMLTEGQSAAEGQAIAEDLMRQLDIQEKDLVNVAYMDLLEQRAQESSSGEKGDRSE
jgi:predicted adenylyl cyclase CyaB